MYAHVTDDIVQGAIEASGMGGGALGSDEWRNACVNDLTDLSRYDPISGFPVYKALLCDVAKAGNGQKGDIGGVGEYVLDETVFAQQMNHRIYLDHNATTPMDRRVKEAIVAHLDSFGNPSSIYAAGKASRNAVETARRSVALLLGTTARRISFTGGGSEANNLAIKGAAFAGRSARNHIITSTIEHPSVLNACRWLEKMGLGVTYLPVDAAGRVNPDDLSHAITAKTCLVSIMLANNETGAIQPIRELAAIARGCGALFHADAVQAAGKIPIDVDELGVDLLTVSGHKFHGPKGIGALYVRKGVDLDPLVSGGHQEHGLRAGTENVLGIVGLGKAAELAMECLNDMENVSALRDRLERAIPEIVSNASVVGHRRNRLPNTLCLVLPGIRGESLVLALDQQGIALSSGSACQSGQPEPSHALMAMGLTEEQAHCSVRFSLGLGNTQDEIDRTVDAIGHAVREGADVIRFVSCR